MAGPILAGTDVVWAEAEHVIARDPESGSPRWRSPARGSRDLLATPTSIIVREPDAVRALGAGDGRELWSVPAGAEGGPLSLASGMLMVPDAGKMRALDPGSGREWFRDPIGGKGGAVPRSTGVSSRQGTLFWGADDGTVTALDFRGTELRGPGRRWRLHGILLTEQNWFSRKTRMQAAPGFPLPWFN